MKMNAEDLVFVDQMNAVKIQLDHTDVSVLGQSVVTGDTKELDKVAWVNMCVLIVAFCMSEG